MDIFGLTPVDAALSAWGLNVAQSFIEFLFYRTHLGVAAFAIGFLYSVWQSAREGNFKHFAVFVFICISGFLLVLVPHRQEPHVKSVMEAYGTSNISAQDIKNSQTTVNTMPLFLSYLGQTVDSTSIGIISTVDNALVDGFRFMNEPLGIEKLSVQVNQMVNAPMANIGLRKDLDDFIYAYYLPSLNMYINAHAQTVDLSSLWPGQTNIVNNYSTQGAQKWSEIRNSLLRFINTPREPLVKIKRLLQQLNITSNEIDNQLLRSIIQHQMNRQDHRSFVFFVGAIHNLFPYIYGWANFCLYVSFPVFILGLIIFSRVSILLGYLEIFIWVKSWVLTTAIAHYVAMVAFRIQIHHSTEVHGIWEYPYFSMLAAILVCLMPVLSFIGLRRSFQMINNRN